MNETEMKNIITDTALNMDEKADVINLLIDIIQPMNHSQLLEIVRKIGE